MKIISLFIIIVCFCSCRGKYKSDLQVIRLESDRHDSLMLSKIASNVNRVILETSDSCLITGIMEIDPVKGFQFVNDAGKRVLEFDASGKFIRQIGSQGRGPGEYNNIYSIATDSVNNLLFVYTYKKILCFDFSGKLIKEIRQAYMPEFIDVIDGNLWVVSSSLGNKLENNTYMNITKLIIYSAKGIRFDSLIIQRVYLKTQAGTTNPHAYVISDLGNTQYLYNPVMLPEPVLRDTVYQVKSNRLIPSIKLDFGDAAELKNGKKQIYISSVFRTGNYLFADYSFSGKKIFSCYDFSNHISYCTNNGITDDFFMTGKVHLRPYDLKNEKLYYIKEGIEIAGKIEGVLENSNPVIFIVKLREYNSI